MLSLFSILNESYHAKLRRAVNNIFALSTLVQYEPFVNSTINVFLEQVEKRFADKEGPEGVVNLPLWLQYYAFDVIGELTYSARYGFLERGEDVDGIIEYLNKYMKYLSVVSRHVSWCNGSSADGSIRSDNCQSSTSCFGKTPWSCGSVDTASTITRFQQSLSRKRPCASEWRLKQKAGFSAPRGTFSRSSCRPKPFTQTSSAIERSSPWP